MNPYYLKYFSNYEYYENIINNIQNIKLSKKQESYLLSFVFYPHFSAYDIERKKKPKVERGEDAINSSEYRQATNIVSKLCDLKLIELDKEKEENPHKKKIYSLTANGLFYIIRWHSFFGRDIQAMIKNYPNFKMLKDLVYPFIKLDTLCSENIPISILNAIFLYIQQYCLKIENFINYAKNKVEWQRDSWNWNIEKLRKFLIEKYKYEWLENAEDKEDNEQTNLIFFNKNKCNQSINIRLRFKGDKFYGYLISGTKNKKKEIPIPNIETFLIKFHLSKEESIGRSFSLYYTISPAEFGFLLLSGGFTSYTYDISLLFSKDENFSQALEAAKEEFDKLYLSIKNPYQYSLESLIAKDLWELAYKRNKDDKW